MRIIIIFAFIVVPTALFSQFISSNGDTLFNQKDPQGLKQGYWKGYYENEKLKYAGFFKDNKPVGNFKRFFDDGSIKAEMVYDITGNKAKATLYYQGSSKAAEGNYVGMAKDSTWNYFSFYHKGITNKETYYKGKKNGLSISYYPSGNIAEEIEFKDDAKHGKWLQYYENGVTKLEALFVAGKRTGTFVVNYPSGKPEWQGTYLNDLKEGVWQHFTIDGVKDSEIEFIKGIAKNAEELDKREQQLLKEMESKKGSIPEPDENSFVPQTGGM